MSTAALIGEMVSYFLPYCDDKSTLNEILTMSKNDEQWSKAHDLFSRIRAKTLVADRTHDAHSQFQYSFEEICAKTFFNLSLPTEPFSRDSPAPFDEDSPFWVIPLGFQFARFLGLDDSYAFTSLLSKDSEDSSKLM